MRSTFPRSSVLILGPNSIQSLLPSTLISQVESLLDSHRINDAIDLADKQRKKLYANISINEDEADELRYVYQRIGFQCFAETRFAEAANNFFDGELDPRLMISYYPELRGALFTSDDAMDVFAGVAERMPTEASVEDIIVTNLVRNYSPHLSPNTREAPSTAELRKILLSDANEKLASFLAKWRARRQIEAGSIAAVGGSTKKAPAVDLSEAVVDTVLVKLYANLEKTPELYALLHEPNHVVVSEVESVLKKTGQYNALCILYKDRGDDVKLLDIWAKLVEGEWTDEDIKDPLSDMMALLNEKRDRSLTQKWGLWLTKRDPENGLKLLMPKDGGKRRERPEEDLALLEQIKEANPAAGIQYLEYLVIQRRSSSRNLHTQLAVSCIEQLRTALSQDSVSKLWRAKASSYSSSRTDIPFLSYFAATTPDSTHKHVRLKTVLFLAGSSLYDPAVIRPLLVENQKILRLELAIVDGKLGNDRAALSTLVHDLHDASSAEAYCTLGGDLVPPKVAQALAETNPGLDLWVSTLFGISVSSTKDGGTRPSAMARQKSVVDEWRKKELLKILLEVYMSDGEVSTGRAAHLINSQAMNLDVLDVISLVPPNWPLHLMSSFLARSFRRTLHDRHEGKIVKTLSAGQNLEVKDETWAILREEGMIVEEAAESDGNESETDGGFGEKQALAEKLALHLGDLAAGTDDIHVEDGGARSEKAGLSGEASEMGYSDLR
ncbi:Transforming growth factor-beta receptor-associated protein 1 [Hypsizygus marmoreus]|uniref:Transforming growth factor-beta receptor-associated protein 1 n=1 Tax=Hypsizygus marmoreus TaxID=39966 RepID=A0A369J5D3_HYPMA|nr:Transforming growth factor-beta receptor-associated protein 1 [Hypsizygus marmoreus]